MKARKVSFEDVEERRFKETLLALNDVKPNVKAMAKTLGLPPTTIYSRWAMLEEKYDVECSVEVKRKH